MKEFGNKYSKCDYFYTKHLSSKKKNLKTVKKCYYKGIKLLLFVKYNNVAKRSEKSGI